MSSPRSSRCTCCTPPFAPRPAPGRRAFLGLAAGLAATTLPGGARAGDGTAYEAMLLSCIDPRLVTKVHTAMAQQGLHNQYSQFAIAGAAIGVMAPGFSGWAPAFWDNLAASMQLHRIKRIVVLNHRDCGAARIAYGNAAVATPEAETALHRTVFAAFAAKVAERQPRLAVTGGLMALDGTVEPFA